MLFTLPEEFPAVPKLHFPPFAYALPGSAFTSAAKLAFERLYRSPAPTFRYGLLRTVTSSIESSASSMQAIEKLADFACHTRVTQNGFNSLKLELSRRRVRAQD